MTFFYKLEKLKNKFKIYNINKINNNVVNKIDSEIANVSGKNLKDELLSLLKGKREWNTRYIKAEKEYIKPKEENEIYKVELEIIEKLNITKKIYQI